MLKQEFEIDSSSFPASVYVCLQRDFEVAAIAGLIA
jgi:hypothetical protein